MPVHIPTNHSPAFKQAISANSRYLTPYVFRKNARRVAKAIDFDDVHRSIAQRQFEYLEQARSNYVRPRTAWFRDLAPDRAFLLGATNMEARIAFAEIAVRRLRERPDLYAEPIFMVTICPRKYACPIDRASQIDLHGLRQTTRQALAGLSFIGAIDFSLFKSWGRDGIRCWNNHVSAHTHCLVFGATRSEIEAAVRRMGKDFVDVTHKCAANVMKITARQLEGYLRYSLKAPLFEVHVKTGSRWWYNAETDERERVPRLDSHPLRPGDQLRMSAVLHDMYLDELFFGQGECTALARDIRDEAREPIRRKNEAQTRSKGKSASSIPPICTLTHRDRLPLSELVCSPPRRASSPMNGIWLSAPPKKSSLVSDAAFFGGLRDLE